jgi:hypothetical protein
MKGRKIVLVRRASFLRTLVACLMVTGVSAVTLAHPAPAATPASPFTECPAVGADSSCGVLIDVTSSGATVFSDPAQGPYDGEDDSLVGVLNQSGVALNELSLSSSSDIFGFDGDGICAEPYKVFNAGCPFGSTAYEGPGTSFEPNDQNSGIVKFNPPIPPGGTSYFSLEEAVEETNLAAGLPDAECDQYWTPPGQILSVPEPGVLVNDSDPAGLPLRTHVLKISFGVSSHPYSLNSRSGALVFQPGGSKTARKATITYDVINSNGEVSKPATITIFIQATKPKLHQCARASFDNVGNVHFDYEMENLDKGPTGGGKKSGNVTPSHYNVKLLVGEPGSVGGPGQPLCKKVAGAESYIWSIGSASASTTGCFLDYEFKKLGSYDVKLQAVGKGKVIGTETKRILVKDWLILVLGDSYASGEGNQPFINAACDRSAASGGWEAGEEVERLDPRTAVTVVDLACSGATVGKAGNGNDIPHQIQEAKGVLEGRVPDAVVMSGGGDDLHFKEVIEDCVKASAVRHGAGFVGGLFGGIGGGFIGSELAKHFEKNCGPADQLASGQAFSHLEASYRQVASELSGPPFNIPHSSVYLTEYADPTHGRDGSLCGTALLDHQAFGWADSQVLVPLNELAERSAHTNGWEFVGRIASAFKRHGYCAKETWFHSLTNSLWNQHSPAGSFHPNPAGQRCYARNIIAHLEATLYLVYPETLLPRPHYTFDKNNPCPS